MLDANVKSGSAEDDELEVLRVLVESYEKRQDEPVHVSAVQAIRYRMDQQSLKPKDLVPYIGSFSKVSEVLAETRPLSVSMMRRLRKGLGIPASVLIDEPDLDTEQDAAVYDYAKFPIAEMTDRGYFNRASLAAVRTNPEKYIPNFLASGASTVSNALLRAPLHQSGSRTMDEYALIAWRARVVNKARRINLSAQYKAGVISSQWLRDLAKLSSFKKGPCLAHEYLANHGIRLVFERHFQKTYLDGAAMLDGAEPIVALTLRHDRVDNFWFALLHECVHVAKHLTPDRLFIADNLDDKARAGRDEEDEADEGAREALIPKKLWDASKVRTTFEMEDALELANKAGVSPAIVAGRVRYQTGDWRLLSGLIKDGGSVSSLFKEQLK